MLAIRHMLTTGDITLLGPFNEIDGKIDFFGVFHYYLMAPALYLANYRPIGPALLTALLGICTIPLIYLLIKRRCTPTIALATTALYAVNPLAVEYVRWPWNPNTTPFFGVLYGLAVTALAKTSKLRYSCLAGLLLGLLFQLHYSTILIGWWWGITWLFLPKWQTKFLHGIGFLVFFIVPNLTFVIFDLRHQFFLSQIVMRSFEGSTTQHFFNPSLLGIFNNAVPFIGATLSRFFTPSIPWWLGFLVGLIITTVLIWRLIALVRQKCNTLELWIVVSWLSTVILIALLPSVVDDYHTTVQWFGWLYLLVLVSSWCIDNFGKSLSTQTRRGLFVGVISLLSVASLWCTTAFLPPTWDQNVPLLRATSSLIATDVRSLQPTLTFNIVALTDSNTKGIRYRYFLDVEGVHPLGIDEYLTPHVIYVISKDNWDTVKQRDLWEISAFKQATLKEIGVIDDFQVYKLTR